MAWWKRVTQLAPLGRILGPLFGGGRQEKIDLNNCLEDIRKKREEALHRESERQKTVARVGTALFAWKDVDQYADERFYQKKLEECYRKHTRLRKAMGVQ